MTFNFVLFLIFCILFYFLPSIIAMSRDHKNGGAIVVVNLFLGWLLIPWVIALAWSVSCNVNKPKDKAD